MKAVFVLFACAVSICHAQSGGTTLAALTEQKAVRLSKQELQELLPGAKVVSVAAAGNPRAWVNDPAGSFIASSNYRGGSGNQPITAKGEWKVGDNGTYCVQLEWKSFTEKWCRYIFKAGDKYYGTNTVNDPAAAALEFSFSK